MIVKMGWAGLNRLREWAREGRCRVFHGPEKIRELYDRVQKSAYRKLCRAQPIAGLSSDPNGFALHDGT